MEVLVECNKFQFFKETFVTDINFFVISHHFVSARSWSTFFYQIVSSSSVRPRNHKGPFC